MNIVKWKQSETSIFQYKSCRLHACFRPLSSIPNPSLALSLSLCFSLLLFLSLFLCLLLALHIQRAKLNMNIAHIYDIYYIFFVFWEAYALLTKYFNLAAFFRTCFACVYVCVWESETTRVLVVARQSGRKQEKETERERTTYRKLFILFLCFNLYLIQFWFSLFFFLLACQDLICILIKMYMVYVCVCKKPLPKRGNIKKVYRDRVYVRAHYEI